MAHPAPVFGNQEVTGRGLTLAALIKLAIYITQILKGIFGVAHRTLQL
jgi:hypothetical protein